MSRGHEAEKGSTLSIGPMPRVRFVLAFAFFLTALAMAGGLRAAPFASYVIDARTGEVLQSENADTRLHPA